MIKLGEMQTLVVSKKEDFGLYLKDSSDLDGDAILLPKREAPEDIDISDHLEVFVYKDSSDRLVCTTINPKLKMGEFTMLKVAQVTKIGAFMEWGLIKDLLLPFKEQTVEVKEGESYFVGLYVDKSERLCATMKIAKLLTTEHDIEAGAKMKGLIYNIHAEIGMFIAVEGKYQGLIPMKEVTKRYHIGSEIEFKVGRVREDGRLDLTLHEGGFTQMEQDEETLYNALVANDGFVPLNDRTDKEKINKELDMSKRAFKRALGRLMKAGKAKQTSEGCELIK